MRERKDESNALQQRTVTDQAFIWAETAAVAGGTRQQQQQQCSQLLSHSVSPPQLEKRWTRRGGGTGDTHLEHTTFPIPAIWFLEYYVGFPSFALQRLNSLFLLILLWPSITMSSVLIWRDIHAKGKRGSNENQHWSLYRSDISTSRRLKRHSAHYASLLSTSLWSPGALSQLCASSGGKKTGLVIGAVRILCSKQAWAFPFFRFFTCMAIEFFLDRKQRQEKSVNINLLHEKKTATKFSFAEFHCFWILCIPAQGRPGLRCETQLVSNRSFQLSFNHVLAVGQTSAVCSWHQHLRYKYKRVYSL